MKGNENTNRAVKFDARVSIIGIFLYLLFYIFQDFFTEQSDLLSVLFIITL